MPAQIIDGKAISQAVRDEVAQEVEELKDPRLGFVTVTVLVVAISRPPVPDRRR